MSIDFTDFGLLGSGNGLSIAKKTNIQQIITEDNDGNILRQTVSTLAPVEAKITELTPEEFLAIQKEDADSIALSGVYDTERSEEHTSELQSQR